jgi:nucleotide-binding universal stress UspA family protein
MSEAAQNKWAHPAVILVATDLSDLDRTMPFAVEQAAATGAQVVVLHVISSGEAMNADVTGHPYYDPLGAAEVTAKVLAPWIELAGQRGVACEQSVIEGNPADVVLATARKIHADRIVVGTRSRGKISKLLIGSVAERVVRYTHVPVVTVGPEAHWETNARERVVLHATQLLPNAKAHAELAQHVAATLNARLVLLHVVEPGSLSGSLTHNEKEAAAEAELKKLAAEIPGIRVEALVAHGSVPEVILTAAKEQKANLVVLGSTPRPALAEITRDRTVYRVLAHAKCPVMTLHAPKS